MGQPRDRVSRRNDAGCFDRCVPGSLELLCDMVETRFDAVRAGLGRRMGMARAAAESAIVARTGGGIRGLDRRGSCRSGRTAEQSEARDGLCPAAVSNRLARDGHRGPVEPNRRRRGGRTHRRGSSRARDSRSRRPTRAASGRFQGPSDGCSCDRAASARSRLGETRASLTERAIDTRVRMAAPGVPTDVSRCTARRERACKHLHSQLIEY